MWELDHKENWAPKNWYFWTVVLEKTLESPWTARKSNQSILKEISPELDWCWSWSSNTLATWCEELTHLKRPCYWERLKAEGEKDVRGWDFWMASQTLWTWVWVSSRSWWWTGKPDVLQSMGSQRVGHDWETEPNWLNKTYWSLHVSFFSANIWSYCSKKKKKGGGGVIFFPFPENKEDKENSEQGWTFLVFFTLTAPNSEYL